MESIIKTLKVYFNSRGLPDRALVLGNFQDADLLLNVINSRAMACDACSWCSSGLFGIFSLAYHSFFLGWRPDKSRNVVFNGRLTQINQLLFSNLACWRSLEYDCNNAMVFYHYCSVKLPSQQTHNVEMTSY